MKRTAFKRRAVVHQPAVEREPRPLARLERSVTYAGSTGAAVPKPQAHRNRALLDMARDRPCLLLFPWVTQHPQDTVVACHSNLSIHGKAGARKADDQYSVWGCAECHRMLDQGSVSPEVKLERFMAAHVRQVNHWRRIASDTGETLRFRNAAKWALDQFERSEA